MTFKMKNEKIKNTSELILFFDLHYILSKKTECRLRLGIKTLH